MANRNRANSRVGIVGCGVIAKVYAEKLNALPFIDLVACADIDAERAAAFAAEHTIPRALSVDELLTDAGVDMVVNLTIPQAHADRQPCRARCGQVGVLREAAGADG